MNTALDLFNHYKVIFISNLRKYTFDFFFVLVYLLIGNAYGMSAMALAFRISHIPASLTGFAFKSLAFGALITYLFFIFCKGLITLARNKIMENKPA
jgi:hypothetical protein